MDIKQFSASKPQTTLANPEPTFPKSLYLLQPLFPHDDQNLRLSLARADLRMPPGVDLNTWIVSSEKPTVKSALPQSADVDVPVLAVKSSKHSSKARKGGNKPARKKGIAVTQTPALDPAVSEHAAPSQKQVISRHMCTSVMSLICPFRFRLRKLRHCTDKITLTTLVDKLHVDVSHKTTISTPYLSSYWMVCPLQLRVRIYIVYYPPYDFNDYSITVESHERDEFLGIEKPVQSDLLSDGPSSQSVWQSASSPWIEDGTRSGSGSSGPATHHDVDVMHETLKVTKVKRVKKGSATPS